MILNQNTTNNVILTLSESVTRFYVYVHFDLTNQRPFYVGKGHGKRAFSKHKRNDYWKNIVNKHGYSIEILEDNLTEDQAYELEKYWISQFKAWGFKLCNMTEGGEGASKGVKLSESHKNKISISLIGNTRTKGFKHSEETIAKRKIISKGRRPINCSIPLSQETKNKISLIHKGKPKSDDTKKKMSIAAKGKVKTEETKMKMRKPKTDEHKKKLSEAAKNRKRK